MKTKLIIALLIGLLIGSLLGGILAPAIMAPGIMIIGFINCLERFKKTLKILNITHIEL